MKRILCAATALLLLLVLVPVPARAEETATVRVDEAGLIGKVFALGDVVEVTEERDGYYVVKHEDSSLLVEKRLIRMAGESVPKSYIGYASSNTDVYENGYLEGEKLATLYLNNQMTVEDVFGPVARVTLPNGVAGYVLAAKINRSPVENRGGGSSGGQDGGDIGLGYTIDKDISTVRLFARVHREGEQPFAPGTGTILAEATEGYVAVLSRGDTVQVTEQGEEVCTVLANEGTGIMQTRLLAFGDEAEYAAWDGYAQGSAPLYRHWRMLDEETKLNLNTKLHVIGEVGNIYIVELEDGLGFVPMDKISRNQITYTPSSGGDWTDPTL